MSAQRGFNKELQSVSEWVAINMLIISISTIKIIVFGTNHTLNPKPQLNIAMNNVEIEQVEKTKLLGVTLDCKWLWSKHIDATVAKIGRGLSIVKRCSAFLTTTSISQVLQAQVLSHLDYCPVMWSGATKRNLGKLQLVQTRQHGWLLNVQVALT
jgi:hypothetical protein